MIKSILSPILKPVLRSLTGVAKRWAYNFDGVDDRGQLQFRAIDPNGANEFEFLSPSVFTGFAQTIISQTSQSSIAAREFELFTGSDNFLIIVRGGTRTQLMTNAQGYTASTRYGVRAFGSTVEIYEGGLDGPLVRSVTAPNGAAREPLAVTTVCCRGNTGGTFISFFQGLQYNLKINGVVWPMTGVNSSEQQSVPAGNPMTLVNTTSDRWQEV